MKAVRMVADTSLPAPGTLVAPWPGEEIMVDGKVVYVRRTPATSPNAEPALYVHGLGGSAHNWTDLAGLLAPWLEGEAIDLPGFGRSEPATSYTLAALADSVIRWIEHSGRGPVHLFGNSLGGAASVRVAATRPDLVRTLTLISPAMPFSDPRRSVQSRYIPLLLIPGAKGLAARIVPPESREVTARQSLEFVYGDIGRVPPQRIDEAIKEIVDWFDRPWFAEAWLGSFRGLVGSFLRSYLPGSGSLWTLSERVQAPTLIIWGEQDRLVSVRTGPRVARLIPDSRLLILEGVGHVAQMEVPRRVARAFLGFQEDLASERP